MTTLTAPSAPLETSTSAAQRLRRIAAAVRVHFTWWGVEKTLTALQKQEVGNAYGADARLLSAGKKIIDVRNPTYRALTSTRSKIIRYWKDLTLPYVEPGMRLIPQDDVNPFDLKMAEFRDELLQAERGLGRVFDQIKMDARRRLGRLFNPDDYPSQVDGLFLVQWDFPSVEPPNYLMRIAPEIYRDEQERVARRFEEAVQLAEQAFISEFARLVSHLKDRLSDDEHGQRRIFRDSVIGNLTDFFGRFRHLNLRSSEELDQLVTEAQELVEGVTAQRLRDSNDLRRHIVEEMAEMETRLQGLIIDRPRRQIVRVARAQQGGNHATPR